MRILALTWLALAACSPAFADLRASGRVIDTIDIYTDLGVTGMGGDTYQFTAWTGTGTGGNFNGGHIFGSYNDGHGCPAGGGNIAFLEIVRLDWTTKTNTSVTCINNMSGYGNTSGTPAGWTEPGVAWKSFNPFSWNGNIYWFINRQEISNPWRASVSSIIVSPDQGRHWCNQATFAASGKCDASNYRADGDPPPNVSTGMMWGSLGNYSSPMARPIVVQFCQDQTCTGTPFGADNYLYFVANTGLVDQLYASCVAKSQSAIMDVAQWWYWKGGNGNCGDTNSWTHTIGNAAPIQNQALDLFGYPSSIIYVRQAGQFLMTSYEADDRPMFLTSNYPWGPWKRIFISAQGSQGGFVATNLAWLDSACAGCNTDPGHWRLTYAAAKYGHQPDASLYFYQVDISNGGPSTTNTQPAGATNLGRLPIRASGGGTGNRLILNGLQRAYAFDDYMDSPSSTWSSAGTYVRDLLGSATANCLVTGTNAAGYMVWASQSGTAPITVSGSGIYLGTNYAAQFSSRDAGCSGPIPLSGDQAFTVQMVFKPDIVSPGSGTLGIFQLQDPSIPDAAWGHRNFYAVINVLGQGGSHIEVSDYGHFLTSNPIWSAGNYYLLTLVKSAGPLSPSTVKLYLGQTNVPLAEGQGASDGLPPNFSPNMKLRLGCFGWNDSWCNPGTYQGTQLPATHSFFALYTRALSADEVAHNYAALKSALSQAPRSITLQ